ncbi:hypothetical protein MA16_Dca022252 [Dendrobium catenatum]|uniref:Uncharacterized protein n=1 Tax=Dendrobium catenatum TaxID=906689 RepID=A0A2I0WH57_9ASPA|nr:hypothetical protein MA16_Dca022252 [Dendrobium catenatum]
MEADDRRHSSHDFPRDDHGSSTKELETMKVANYVQQIQKVDVDFLQQFCQVNSLLSKENGDETSLLNSKLGIQSHLVKRQGALGIKEVAELSPKLVKHVEGKGKAVIDMVEMVTPNSMRSSVNPSNNNASTSGMKIFFNRRTPASLMVVHDYRQRIAGNILLSEPPQYGQIKSYDQFLSKSRNEDFVSMRKSSNLVINEGFQPPLKVDPILEGVLKLNEGTSRQDSASREETNKNIEISIEKEAGISIPINDHIAKYDPANSFEINGSSADNVQGKAANQVEVNMAEITHSLVIPASFKSINKFQLLEDDIEEGEVLEMGTTEGFNNAKAGENTVIQDNVDHGNTGSVEVQSNIDQLISLTS